jgi:hypothetical protein
MPDAVLPDAAGDLAERPFAALARLPRRR